MEATPNPHLSRRERQIMDVVYRRGEVTVTEVLEELPEPPSYSAVRAMLGKLEGKGQLRHEAGSVTSTARRCRGGGAESAVERLIHTFFDGSASNAVAAILDASSRQLSQSELAELAGLIEQARRRGR
jgi:predicted transcriptional regulator